jgi:hypothetical protein
VDRKPAMKALAERLAAREREVWDAVLADHGIAGAAASELRRAIVDFEVRGATGLETKAGALLGGVLTGALYGLAADAFAGGLTLGGGMIAGGILGALGGAGLTRAYQLFQRDEEPGVGWSQAALVELAQRMVVRYLAVAHFGRGRGAWREEEEPAAWRELAARVVPARAPALAPRDPGDAQRATAELTRTLDRALRTALAELYPGAWER